MPTIEQRQERKRGCGWRKEGGLYLVSDAPSMACGRLPLTLDVCPTCQHGIKPSRGWTWIDADALFAGKPCHTEQNACIYGCPLSPGKRIGMAGLLWIGGAYYASPTDWLKEACEMGISRRISAIPRGFKLGETYVLVAHRDALYPKMIAKRAIVNVFKPKAIEYVVTGKETESELEALENRGVTLVQIERLEEQPTLLKEE